MAMGEMPKIKKNSNPIFIVGLEASPNNLIVDSTAYQKIWDLCNKNAFDLIYLQASESIATDQKSLSNFITQAHKQEIKVIIVDGSPDWVYKPAQALKLAEAYLLYYEGHQASEKPDGLLLNVAYNNLSKWSDEKNIIVENYFSLVKSVRQKLAYSGQKIPFFISANEAIAKQYQDSNKKHIDGVLSLETEYPFLEIKSDLTFEVKNLKLAS